MKALYLAVLLAVILPAVAAADAPEPYRPPQGYVLFVVGPKRAVEVPHQFAVDAVRVIQCESRWNTEAVGKAGELGWLQVHPVHFPRMRALGLSPQDEGDRLLYAVQMWEAAGRKWSAWSCR